MAALSSNWRARPDVCSEPTFSTAATNQKGKTIENSSWNPRDDAVKPSMAEIRGEDDPRTMQAIEEGRRLYVGNLPYSAGAKDIDDLFMNYGYEIEHINISVDPFTGRNPSYCFVELPSKDLADSAIEELSGQSFLGRPVKVGPGKVGKSKQGQRRSEFASGYRNQAYSRSSFQPSSRTERSDKCKPSFQRWNRVDARDHWEGYTEGGCRLWVGGLPKMANHASVNKGVRELFEGFNIEAVSKVIIPRHPGFGHPDAWDHRYLFVDFSSADEAQLAAQTTDGRRAWGVKVHVRVAKPVKSGKALEAKQQLKL